MLFFWTFYSSKNPEKIYLAVFNNYNKYFFEQQIRILERFMKDHVTGVNDANDFKIFK